MEYKKIITSVILCISLIIVTIPIKSEVRAASDPALYLQMVPCGKTSAGKNFNAWSDYTQCLSSTVNSASSRVLFENPPSDKDKFTYFFLKYEKEKSADLPFTIIINNARVELANGKTIYLDKLNGVYEKPAEGDIISDYELSGISAGQFYKSRFKADVTVNFGSFSEYGSASHKKFPASGTVTYNGNVILLDNVSYNGTLTLTGGKKYKNGVIIRLKGNSKIKGLVAKCPIKIASDGNSSLTCQTVNDTKGNISGISNISVKKQGAGEIYSASPITLDNLAEITYTGKDKVLPQKLYYSVKDNTITLEDFHFDGGINLTGGGYDNLKLVLKGSNSIGELTVSCPVKIERYSYAELICGKYSEKKPVGLDKNTSIRNSGGRTEFAFSVQSGHKYKSIFNSEETGFKLDSMQTSNDSTPDSWPYLEQLSETTVNGLQGVSKGLSMTFKRESSIPIDILKNSKNCSPDEKFVLSFYARVVSANPGDTAWGSLSLIPRDYSGNKSGDDIFNWRHACLPLTTKWQKFTFSGFWPADIQKYSDLSLCLGSYDEGIKVEYSGVQLLGKGSFTAGELDELTGMYDYDWRHKDAAWRAEAQKMIDTNRKGALTLSITDGSGKPLDGAKVTVRQKDYAYEFGVGCDADGVMTPEGEIFEHFKVLKKMGINSIIDYNSILWEYYFDDGKSNETYDFDRSSRGDVDFVSAAVKMAQQNNVKYNAHVLIYPRFSFMQQNPLCSDNYDKLVEYVLSDKYSPDGFKKLLEDHIRQVVKSYAGIIKSWNVVNEEHSPECFFALIYGTDGRGIDSSEIKSVTKGYATNNEKIAALEEWLKSKVPFVPAAAAGKYIAEFCDAAQQAWVDAGCNPEELILNYNDFATKVNDFNYRGEFYSYVTQLSKELANPANYKGGKVLTDRIGFQFGDLNYTTLSPDEIWSILDEYEAMGLPVWSTEFNYWLDNPLSDYSRLSDYGTAYNTKGCGSKAELEFIHDYGEAVITAMYAHRNSLGIYATSYPHGQIGYFMGFDYYTLSPMGEAFRELTGNKWHTPDQSGTAKGGKFSINNAALGKYEITVTYGKITKTFNADLAKKSNTYTLKLTDTLFKK